MNSDVDCGGSGSYGSCSRGGCGECDGSSGGGSSPDGGRGNGDGGGGSFSSSSSGLCISSSCGVECVGGSCNSDDCCGISRGGGSSNGDDGGFGRCNSRGCSFDGIVVMLL